MDREVRWRPENGTGLEHLRLRQVGSEFHAEGVVIGERGGIRFGLTYGIVCDASWRFRQARLAVAGGAVVELHADGEGHWRDGNGQALPAFDGCIDIDISATPFTNALPIRRLGLKQGESRDIRVVYIPAPALQPEAVDQRYTCLAEDRLYRYEGLFRGFVGDLAVDPDGLVIDYPETFRRLG